MKCQKSGMIHGTNPMMDGKGVNEIELRRLKLRKLWDFLVKVKNNWVMEKAVCFISPSIKIKDHQQVCFFHAEHF